LACLQSNPIFSTLPAALKSCFRIIIGFQNMPFTLAHPVAVLPFSRCRYCHFPALVIGSLSPDFVYFLHGRAVSGGHGLLDMLWPNLPLCFAFYWLYLALWRDALSDFLPNCLNAAPYRPSENVDSHKIKAALFIPSALFGMATHLFLDAFTHSTGWFVQHFPVLQRTVLFLPIFKWLQYGSGLIGVTACLYFVFRTAHRRPYRSHQTIRQKYRFWILCTILSLFGFSIWQIIAPVPLGHAATQTIRLIDCVVILFSIVCLRHIFRRKYRQNSI